MPGALRRSSLLALAAALALCGMLVTARSAPAKFAITKCGRVSDVDGSKAPVSAHKLSCTRAKKVARYFLQNDDAPPGWKHGNPAGCEWVFARNGAKLRHWRVLVVRFRGCQD